ncbi:MAG: von Willebrand factor type A domain-containing protein [Planctomycetota bacterium]
MSIENPINDDHRDRLIDYALREIVGGETPPDLSERIMHAANSREPAKPASLSKGVGEITQQSPKKTLQRRSWVLSAIAASLLVSGALLWPELRGSRESAYSTPGDKLVEENSAEIDLPSFESTPVTSTIEVPNGETVVSGGTKRLMDDRKQISRIEEEPLIIGVTPRIIVQEQEEKPVGITISQAEKQVESKFQNLRRDENRSQSELPSTGLSVDLGQSFRSSTFGPATPQFGGSQATTAQSESAVPERLNRHQQSFYIGRSQQTRDKNRDESNVLTSDGRRFRLDAVPGRDLNRYLIEPDVINANDSLVVGDQGLTEELDVKGEPTADVVLPAEGLESTDLALVESAPLRQSRGESSRTERQIQLARRLDEKVENYRTQLGRVRDNFYFRQADQVLFLKLETEIKQLKLQLGKGRGADASGDKYARIHDNPFVKAIGEKAVSTFSIDVDTAAYANVRQMISAGHLPPPDAVRIEELINYFDYAYTPPTDDTPFASHVEVAGCPWKAGHRLVRVGIKGRELQTDNRPQSNLVFLVDVSGSMNEPAKLPLLVEGLKMLTRELGENDRIAIVVYASSEGLALPSTRGDQQDTILSALEKLRAGGSTAGGAGIQLAYEIAEKNFIKGGVNRIILATDGDFNVGTTSTAALETMAEEKAKETGVFMTVLGFGRGNLRDELMEAISNKGNGNYHYIDNTTEARKVLVAEMAGTLVTIAKDMKIQIEFNPAQVNAYRLIGYENRMLRTEDFNDDTKDAGEIGAGHTVTAVYEVVPTGMTVETPGVDPLKYQQPAKTPARDPAKDNDASDELLTLKIRYKQPDEDVSTKLEFPITDDGHSFAKASDDFKFASAVASFGMLLRHSPHQGITSYSAVEEIAQDGMGKDKHGYRAEFLQLVRQAKLLSGG